VGEEAEKSKGMKQREMQLRLRGYLQGRCPNRGSPNGPGKLWEYRLFRYGQQGVQAGRHISEDGASLEKHRVPCAALLVPSCIWCGANLAAESDALGHNLC